MPYPHLLPMTAVLLSLSAMLTGCSAGEESSLHQKDKTYRFTILHTNDHHGRFWKNEHGEWGMAARKTLIDNIRKEVKAAGGSVLLLSAGDINTGVPESDLQQAVPDIKGMNLMGYDAMAVGNHEFDNSMDVLRNQQQLANFPFLSANTYDAETGYPLFDAYKQFSLNGLSVAVMGLTTAEAIKTGKPECIREIDFRPPISVASSMVPIMRETADVVIAISHLGFRPDAGPESRFPGDAALANNVAGIDIIVGGHSQTPLFEAESWNNTWILQSQGQGSYLGRADFEFKNGQLRLKQSQLIPVNHVNQPKRVPEDPEMLALLEPYQLEGQRLLEEKLGTVDMRLKGEQDEIVQGHTSLGKLVATAMMERVTADFAVISSGNIKASLPQGDISYRDILNTLPAGYKLAYVDLSGEEVLSYLDTVGTIPAGSSAYPQFAGVTVEVNGNKVTDINIRNTAIALSGNYRMAFTTFQAAGGEGYPVLKNHPRYATSELSQAHVLKQYIEKNSPLQAANYQPVP